MKREQRFIAFTLSAVFAVTAFSACQPTPDAPIVNAGDDTELNDKIEATAIPTPEADENISAIYGFPTEYSGPEGFQCVDTDISFTFDARVSVPDVKAAPVFEAKPTGFSPEYIKQFTEKMNPGLTFYEYREILLKAEIEKRLKQYQEYVAMPWDEFLENYDNGSEEDARQYYEQCKAMVDKYKELLTTAPESVERKPADFTYHDLHGYYEEISPEQEYLSGLHGENAYDLNDGRQYMRMTAKYDDELDVFIEVWSRFDKDVSGKLDYRIGYDDNGDGGFVGWDAGEAGVTTLARSQAEELGSEVIEKMGLADVMTLTDTQTVHSTIMGTAPDAVSKYILTYHRGVNGIDMQDVKIKNDYNFVNGTEKITITIQHNMVTNVEYECPYETIRAENENVSLISFEEACAAFKKQAAVEFTKSYVSGGYLDEDIPLDEDSIVKNWNGIVTKIRFVMVRIPMRDGGYRYVPAWQFRGTYLETEADGKENNMGTQYTTTFMTINAVDGTRISGMQ